ncbi:Sulfotransferase, partial [Trinorchestia longiramus]
EVLKIRDVNYPERQRRHKVSPLKSLPKDEWWPVVLEPTYGKFFANLNLTSYSGEDAAYIREHLPTYAGRARQVSEVCSGLPRVTRHKVLIKTFVFDTRHTPNLVWCQLPKIASSSWNMNFLKLGHADDKEDVKIPSEEFENEYPHFNLHHEVFRLFPTPNTTKERNQVFIGALRFMIVRHPFVRLISAYRDKMAQDRPKPVWFHYEKLQKLIINRYRPADSSEASEYPTFAEFVQFLLDQTAGLETPRQWNREVQERAWLHHINNTSSGDVADEFFAQLTRSQVEELYQRYKIDFDLFGYSPQHYIDLAS